MEEKSREQLESEISALQEELDAKVSELEEINSELGITPENESEIEPDESELWQRKKAVEEEILVKQMKIVALKRALNDVASNDAMNSASEGGM